MNPQAILPPGGSSPAGYAVQDYPPFLSDQFVRRVVVDTLPAARCVQALMQLTARPGTDVYVLAR